MGRVGLGRDFSVFGELVLVGSTTAKLIKIRTNYVNAFKARLYKIWLRQALKLVGCIGLGRVRSKFFHLWSVGSGWVS